MMINAFAEVYFIWSFVVGKCFVYLLRSWQSRVCGRCMASLTKRRNISCFISTSQVPTGRLSAIYIVETYRYDEKPLLDLFQNSKGGLRKTLKAPRLNHQR